MALWGWSQSTSWPPLISPLFLRQRGVMEGKQRCLFSFPRFMEWGSRVWLLDGQIWEGVWANLVDITFERKYLSEPTKHTVNLKIGPTIFSKTSVDLVHRCHHLAVILSASKSAGGKILEYCTGLSTFKTSTISTYVNCYLWSANNVSTPHSYSMKYKLCSSLLIMSEPFLFYLFTLAYNCYLHLLCNVETISQCTV
jgi:hypothetical protein